MNAQEQAYLQGFVKRANEYVLSQKQALDLAESAPIMPSAPSQPISLALNPAQQQINAGGNYTNPVNFKMEDLAKGFQAKGRVNDLSKEILGKTPYPVSGRAGNYLMNANKINQLGQNMFKQSELNTAYLKGFVKRAGEYGLSTDDAFNILKKANLSGTANNAIQSPVGQKILGSASNVYNSLPNVIKKPVQNYFANKQTANSGYAGFNPNQNNESYVESQKIIKNDNIQKDYIRTTTPGTAGAPLSQITSSLAHGGMLPKNTYPQGSAVSRVTEINNDNITSDALQPRNSTGTQPGRGSFFNK